MLDGGEDPGRAAPRDRGRCGRGGPGKWGRGGGLDCGDQRSRVLGRRARDVPHAHGAARRASARARRGGRSALRVGGHGQRSGPIRARRGAAVSANLRLGGGGEFDRLRRIFARLGRTGRGLGGDCALIRVGRTWLAVSIDLSLERVHFRTGWLSFREIGWRSAAAALSDLAAEGAQPFGVLVSLGIPGKGRGRGKGEGDPAVDIMAGGGGGGAGGGAPGGGGGPGPSQGGTAGGCGAWGA